MDADDLTPFTPPSTEFANNTPTFELTSEQQKLVDKDIEEEEEAAENYKKLQVMKQIVMKIVTRR